MIFINDFLLLLEFIFNIFKINYIFNVTENELSFKQLESTGQVFVFEKIDDFFNIGD